LVSALTGLLPQLPKDADTDELSGMTRRSPELAAVIDKMVRYDFRQRYPSASEALQALKELTSPLWHSSNFITNTPAAVQNKPMLTKTLSGFNLIRVNRTGYWCSRLYYQYN